VGGLARGLAGRVARVEGIDGAGQDGSFFRFSGCCCMIVVLVDYLYLMRCS
jgi:hypothetical protein